MEAEDGFQSVRDLIEQYTEEREDGMLDIGQALANVKDKNDLRVLGKALRWQEAARALSLTLELQTQYLASQLTLLFKEHDMIHQSQTEEDFTEATWGILELLHQSAVDRVLNERDEPRQPLTGLEP